MKLDAERLGPRLSRSPDPLYLISGAEPLLVAEAADAIRAAARAAGFEERETLFVEPGFDWARLAAGRDNLSLFAGKKLLEVRLKSGKPGVEGSRALVEYAADPPDGVILLVITGKLESAQLRSKWVKTIEKTGVHVHARPVPPEKLPAWITDRMHQRGLEPRGDAAALLADRVEGNLLAANQEILKLELIAGRGPIDGHAVREAVADSARFDVFQMVDAALVGDVARAMRIVDGLTSEGVPPPLVLWAITREVRTLARLAWAMEQGASLDTATKQLRVWFSRRELLQRGLKRHRTRDLQALLLDCATTDLVIKGRRRGSQWGCLIELLRKLGGDRSSDRSARAMA